MNGNDPLAALHDIHLPAPVGWWPPAPGWWLLAFITLTGLGMTGYLLWRYYWHHRYRRAALRELRALRNAAGFGERRWLIALAALVRRVAIESCGRGRIAELSGESWLRFLDQSGRTTEFSNGAGRALGDDLYRPCATADPDALLTVIGEWIRRHRPC